MASRSALRRLMTGAAIASLSTAAFADGWTGLIAFGGRDYDSGQYVSSEAVFAEPDEGIGDGRQRATNSLSEGGRAVVVSQRVSDALGYPSLNPSQPQSHEDIPTPADGWNYSALFYSSEDILDSITGTTTTRPIRFQDSNGIDEALIPGRTRAGLLNDPDRAGDAWGALVLVGSAQRDLRRAGDVDYNLDGTVDIYNTRIETTTTARDFYASLSADNIVTGVNALTNAGAGLVVVSNAYDAGAMPEVIGDNAGLEEADTLLQAREDEAAASETAALAAEAASAAADFNAQVAETQRDTVLAQFNTANNDPASDPADVAAFAAALAAAETVLNNADATAAAQAAAAVTARTTADDLALTTYEIDLRPQLDAAIADPTLIQTMRTGATDAYNARLVQQLRGNDGNVVLIDQHALFEAVIDDPARFGLSAEFDQANECVSGNDLFPCEAAAATVQEMLFVDGVNLTQTGHQLAADQIIALVEAPAAISGIPAIGISAGRGISDVGRDQVSREQSWKAGVVPFVAGGASRVQLNKENGFPQQNGGFYSGVVGVKYVPQPGFAVGIAGGYQKVTTPGDSASIEYDGDALFGTAFAGVNTGPVFGSVTATYGKVNYGDVTRISQIGGANIRNTGDTEGTVFGITGEAGLRLVEYDIVRAGPIANVSHWRSDADGYSENGWEVTAVRTGDLETESTRAGIGAFFEAGMLMDGQGSLFRAKVLYGHEFGDETTTASVTPLGANSVGSFSTQVRGVEQAPLEFGAEIVLGYRGVITTLGYDGILGDVSDHRFRIGASMPL